jgi:hypothetical protein
MNHAPVDKNTHLDVSPFEMQKIIEPALEEILGDAILNCLLAKTEFKKYEDSLEGGHHENPGVDVNTLQASLEEMFGQHAGSGLTLQVGRASFKYLLQTHGNSLGFSSMPFRLLPLSRKIEEGSKALIDFLSEATHHSYQFEKTKNWYSWQITYKHSDPGITVPRPICMFIAGLLQETFYWMSAGQTYKVEEACCHDPDKQACTIRIERNPID